jgi:AcrR family transcriptional regulator
MVAEIVSFRTCTIAGLSRKDGAALCVKHRDRAEGARCMLSMELLGALTIRVDDQRIGAEFGPAGRRLASYLAQYSGRPHRRERLVDLFWAGLEPNRARSAVSTALWRLRKVIAAEPRSKGGCTLGNEIVLEPADWLTIDTHSFDASVKSALRRIADEAGEPSTTLLADAVGQYSGLSSTARTRTGSWSSGSGCIRSMSTPQTNSRRFMPG